MAWSSGGELFGVVANVIRENIDDPERRKAAYKRCLDAFGDHDCDNCSDCGGIDQILDDLLTEGYSEEEKRDWLEAYYGKKESND